MSLESFLSQLYNDTNLALQRDVYREIQRSNGERVAASIRRLSQLMSYEHFPASPFSCFPTLMVTLPPRARGETRSTRVFLFPVTSARPRRPDSVSSPESDKCWKCDSVKVNEAVVRRLYLTRYVSV